MTKASNETVKDALIECTNLIYREHSGGHLRMCISEYRATQEKITKALEANEAREKEITELRAMVGILSGLLRMEKTDES